MQKSFYRFIESVKGPRFRPLANKIYADTKFPKQSSDYEEISTYLEMNLDYIDDIAEFDDLWDRYSNLGTHLQKVVPNYFPEGV
ncbi:MAG: YozE family protein [Lactobacillales bacterium]|jgi:uncharacterized protein YozE (UPF0346 family)|nr:YozE family protein [Lactobacillales bacterium]